MRTTNVVMEDDLVAGFVKIKRDEMHAETFRVAINLDKGR